jgi:iron complex transport system ATP-binding protein
VLSTDKIDVSYDGRHGKSDLSNITLSIVPGQITAIVGPNGSGKSTLVRALSRVHLPSNGVVLLDGNDLYTKVSARQSAQKISVAPQDTHVAFDFTSRDIIAMGLAPHQTGWSHFSGETRHEAQLIDSALNKASLTADQASRPVMTLSGGERQRALIARALVQHAEIILLDEPTASLDLNHQATLFQQLEELALVEGKAVVVVLHDLNVAAAHADRIVVLNGGKIVADGAPNEVLTDELLWSVYKIRGVVSENPFSGRRQIYYLPGSSPGVRLEGIKIFVICGGGGGSALMRDLVAEGAALTIGGLNEGDMDRRSAELIGVRYEPLRAFQAVPRYSEERVARIATENAITIFSPGFIDTVNVESLAAAVDICKLGCPVIATEQLVSEFQQLEINMPGAARELWSELTNLSGFLTVCSLDGIVSLIDEAVDA